MKINVFLLSFLLNSLGLFATIPNPDNSYNIISIADYGANPDYGNDDTQAIQDAINANPNRKIFFPAGWYRITSPIIIDNKVELVGEGENEITIIQPSDCHGFIINKSGVVIKDMQIIGRQDSVSTSVSYSAIRVNGNKQTANDGTVSKNYIYNCRFENLRILDVGIGLELKYTWQSKINKVDFFKRDYEAVDSLGNPLTNLPRLNYGIVYYGKCVNNTIRDCHITSEIYNIYIKKNPAYDERAEGLMINNCLIALGRSAIFCEGILSLNVTNSILDLCTDYTVHMFNSMSVMLSNNWIFSKNRIYDIPKDEVIHMETCSDVHVSNNSLICDTGVRGVSINGSSNVKILGNTIYMHLKENAQSVYVDEFSHKNIIKDNTIRNDQAFTEDGTLDIEDYKLPSLILVYGNNNIIKDNLNSKYFIHGNKNLVQDIRCTINVYGNNNYFEGLFSTVNDFGTGNVNNNRMLGY